MRKEEPRDKDKRAKRYEKLARQRAEGFDVSRSPFPPLTSDNLDRPSSYEYERNEINRENDTITPLRTFEIYTREGTPWNIKIDQDTQENLVEKKNLTTSQSEETTSRQDNQSIEEYLQQRENEPKFDYRVPIISNTTRSGTTVIGPKWGLNTLETLEEED